jgi:hypothetical protein
LLLAALVGLAASVALIGKLVFSGFSILDDHHIIEWLGSQDRVPFDKLWSILMSSEVGAFATSGRYRPILYVIVVGETWLWGNNPAGYHVMLVIWFGIFLWSVAWATFRTIGVIGGLAILFAVVNSQYWGNLWTNSFLVAEQPAVFGFALVLFGFGLTSAWFVRGYAGHLDGAVLLVSVGSLICIGSKENFMPLLGLNLLLVAFGWWKRKVGPWALTASFIMMLVDAAICYAIIVPNLGKATDFYGADNSIGHRLGELRNSPLFNRVVGSTVAGTLVAGFGWWSMARREGGEPRSLVSAGIALLVSGLYLAWEIFVYNGRLPTGVRYDFPGLLIHPVIAATIFFLALQAARYFGLTAGVFKPPVIQAGFAAALVGTIALFSSHQMLPVTAAVSKSNARTQAMVSDLGRARELAGQHQDWPIIVSPSRPFDFEAVVTLPLWLKYFGMPNPISVRVNVEPQNIANQFEEGLVEQMRVRSRNGIPGWFEPRNAAIEAAEAKGHCYAVAFGPSPTACVPLPYRPALYLPTD